MSLTSQPAREAMEQGSAAEGAELLVLDATTHVLKSSGSAFLLDSTAGVVNLILPHPRNAAGRTISGHLITDGGNVTVAYYKGETVTAALAGALTAVQDTFTVRSDGQIWVILNEVST